MARKASRLCASSRLPTHKPGRISVAPNDPTQHHLTLSNRTHAYTENTICKAATGMQPRRLRVISNQRNMLPKNTTVEMPATIRSKPRSLFRSDSIMVSR